MAHRSAEPTSSVQRKNNSVEIGDAPEVDYVEPGMREFVLGAFLPSLAIL